MLLIVWRRLKSYVFFGARLFGRALFCRPFSFDKGSLLLQFKLGGMKMCKTTKLISLLLSLIMVFSAFSVISSSAFAGTGLAETGVDQGTTGYCQWALVDGVLTISGEGPMNHYDQQITPWSDLEFTKVVIEDGVTSIGKDAFANSYYLESIHIGKSVSIIYSEAFRGCDSLKSVFFSNGLKEIGSYAFSDCPSLVSITFPDSIETINRSAFWNCPKLTSVSLPAGIISIANESLGYFEDDDYQLTKVEGFSIYGYSGTVAWTYANEHGFIFVSRGKITSGKTGDCIWKLNGTELTISGNGMMADYNRDTPLWGVEITKVIVSDGVTRIGESSFSDCTKLRSIHIGNTVSSIGSDALFNCNGLSEITVSPDNAFFDSRDNCNAIIVTNSNLLRYGCKNTIIPDSVKIIGSYAFWRNSGLTSIYIPNSVKEIYHEAFAGCTSLSEVNISNSVTEIGYGAFAGCTSLTKVTLPNSLTKIEDGTFEDCINLKSVIIPDSVTDIGNGAFGYYWDKNDEYHMISGFTIYGKKDSAAERYANDNGFTFIAHGSGQTITAVLGDVDGSGEADAIDATIIQRYATMISVPYDKEQLMAGDVDDDGEPTVLDATYIQRFSTKVKVPYAIGEPIA